jgi:hypothetical protein
LPAAAPVFNAQRRNLVITIGIDPHKSSITAVAVDAAGRQQHAQRLAVTNTTTQQLLAWAIPWEQRQWAVEGATGLGRGLAQQLAAAGEVVVDVPAKLAARARLLSSGNARKTDAIDAASVAAVAQHHQRLNQVQAEDHTTVLRLLTERRDDVVAERTRCINRHHVQLRDLHPAAPIGGSAPKPPQPCCEPCTPSPQQISSARPSPGPDR